MGVRISTSNEGKVMVRNGEESSLVAEVEEKQLIDPALAQMKEAVLNNKTLTFSLGGEDGVLRCQGRLCVPDVDNLWGRVMAEAHNSRYSMHLGSTKMYRDIKEIYWWNGMKMGVANFVSKCPNCQQVKAEHQRPGGLTQLMEIPMWKWEMINMDFEKVVGDPSTIVPIEAIEVNEELSYEEILVVILDKLVRKLRNKEVASVKVLWQSQQVEEDMWEKESEMKEKNPHVFEQV
ncbi:uncharacterized protein LOC107803648 [Nicotiana tabacum]|uniref:Uncharacterized protein LOC107803648 n=1 Tax=Nicotiana tabacum TaxID=4097 RepID=A0AC58UR73_TOBAC